MRAIIQRLSDFREYVFIRSDYIMLEAANAYLLLVWVIAVLPTNTSLFAAGKAYSVIATFVSENQFGAFFLFLLLNSIFALLLGSLKYRLACSLTQTLVYASLFFLFVQGVQQSNGGVSALAFIMGGLALFSFIVSARIARDIHNRTPSWTLR